jgi:hypothetical protein
MPTSNRPPPLLPKSRTIGILSNFTTSFSRSSLNLDDNQQGPGTVTHPADISIYDSDYAPLIGHTPILHQIRASMTNSYWCGRFRALCDRFHDETLLLSPEATKQYVTDDSDGSNSISPPSSPSLSCKETHKSKQASELGGSTILPHSRMSDKKDEEQDKRSSQAFLHLQSLCTTNEARRSLWEFQLHFARIECKSYLLPKGGKMEDGRGGWLGRVGRAIVGVK